MLNPPLRSARLAMDFLSRLPFRHASDPDANHRIRAVAGAAASTARPLSPCPGAARRQPGLPAGAAVRGPVRLARLALSLARPGSRPGADGDGGFDSALIIALADL